VDWIGLGQVVSSCEFFIELLGFHEMVGKYRVSKQLGISPAVLSSIAQAHLVDKHHFGRYSHDGSGRGATVRFSFPTSRH
jgi:hypothetical protein